MLIFWMGSLFEAGLHNTLNLKRRGCRLPLWCPNSRRFPVLSRTLLLASRGYDRWRGMQWNSTMIEFKGSHFERDVILWGVRW